MQTRKNSFERAWSKKAKEGYQYGEDALENVRFGWEIGITTLVKHLRKEADCWNVRLAAANVVDDGARRHYRKMCEELRRLANVYEQMAKPQNSGVSHVR